MNSKKQVLFCFSWIWLTKFSNKIRDLLMIKNVSLISKFYHYMNELIMIKRLIAFILKFNDVIIVFMRFMISHHEVRIVKLIYTNEKVAESQWIHRLHVRLILHIDMRFFMLTFNSREFNNAFKKWKSDDFSQFNAADTFSHVMISLRHLTIANFSLLLNRLDRMLRKIDRNTLIDDINLFRAKDLSAHHIVDFVRRQDDSSIKTDMKKLRFLLYETSTLRYILHQVHHYVLSHTIIEKKKKIFIIENVFFNAFFLKCVCNFIYVEVEVLHADLIDSKRMNLVNRFNDSFDSLIVFIIMYQIFAQNVNLNKCCFRIIVATSIINGLSKIQAWFRIIRVNSLMKLVFSFKLIWKKFNHENKSRSRNSFSLFVSSLKILIICIKISNKWTRL
jgi:hypothetical protein